MDQRIVRELEALNAFVSIGRDEDDVPFVFLNVLRRIGRCLSSEDVRAIAREIDKTTLDQEQAMEGMQHRELLPGISEMPFTEEEVCRLLLSTLALLGVRFSERLPDLVDEGVAIILGHLFARIRQHAIREATVVFLS